ncbi:MAG: hypothetical protein WCX46_04600 [Candidatus Paceibacterota bacterium]
MKDEKIEEIIKEFIRPIGAGERIRYISEEEAKENLRQTLLEYRKEIRKEIINRLPSKKLFLSSNPDKKEGYNECVDDIIKMLLQ